MADITHNDPVVTESKLTEFYNDIKPFLGCPAYLTSEGNAEYYSTDEKVIGRWINGKPLYQKVWANQDTDIILPTNNWVSASNISLNNVEELINCFIVSNQLTSDNAYYQFNFAYGWSKTNNCLMIQNTRSTNNSLGVDGRTYNVVLRYTKTTDSATTTIQEDPNEYSTDEKIIGKWIDNRPIYQKTISTGSLGTGTIEIAHGISNVDELIYSVGTAKRSDGYKFSFPTLHTNPNWDAFIHGINTTNIVLQIGSSFVGTYQLMDSTVTIQYTKTTD